jgi:hypothetical protein
MAVQLVKLERQETKPKFGCWKGNQRKDQESWIFKVGRVDNGRALEKVKGGEA